MVTSTGVDLGKSGMKPWSAFFFSWKYQKSSRIHSTICKQIPHINHDLKEKEKRKKKRTGTSWYSVCVSCKEEQNTKCYVILQTPLNYEREGRGLRMRGVLKTEGNRNELESARKGKSQ